MDSMMKIFLVLVAFATFTERCSARGCFWKGSRVMMADGSMKEIELIRSGEVVVSWNETSGKTTNSTVMALLTFQNDAFVRVETYTSLGQPFGPAIFSTLDHPYYSHRLKSVVSFQPERTRSEYKLEAQAALEKEDEILEDVGGNPVRARAFRVQSFEVRETYTLCLENVHWFYVEGVRVHNKGCFLPETEVLMADGRQQPLESIKEGDTVVSWDEKSSKSVNSTVRGILSFKRSELAEFSMDVGDARIYATPDHPFWSRAQQSIVSLDPEMTHAEYQLKVKELQIQDEYFEDQEGNPVPITVNGVHILETPTTVMTLCLDDPHWFFIGNQGTFVRVHNKGCFVGSTKVLLPSGEEKEIATVKVGDFVLSWNGRNTTPAQVISVLEFQRNDIIELHFNSTHGSGNARTLYSTPDHPFWSPRTKSIASFSPKNTELFYGLSNVAQLKEDDFYLSADGKTMPGKVVQHHIFSNSSVPVYTLALNGTHFFFAESVLVHNKGIFSGDSSFYIIVGIIIGCLAGLFCACVILAVIFGAIYECIFGKPYSVAPDKVEACFQNSEHKLQEMTPSDVALETGDKKYKEGFICDKCNASFPITVNLYRCKECSVDVCNGCLKKRNLTLATELRNDDAAVVVLDQEPHGPCTHSRLRITAQEISEWNPELSGAQIACNECQRLCAINEPLYYCVECRTNHCAFCLFGGSIQHTVSCNECILLTDTHPKVRRVSTEVSRSGVPGYSEGFICDNCKGLYDNTIPFSRCTICSYDFCDGCLDTVALPLNSPVSPLNLNSSSQEVAVEVEPYKYAKTEQ